MKSYDFIQRKEAMDILKHEADSFENEGGDWEKFAEGMSYAIDLLLAVQGVEIAPTKLTAEEKAFIDPREAKRTNGDHIRKMNDHELAKYLAHFFYRGDGEKICYGSCGCGQCRDEKDCIDGFEKWLKTPRSR